MIDARRCPTICQKFINSSALRAAELALIRCHRQVGSELGPICLANLFFVRHDAQTALLVLWWRWQRLLNAAAMMMNVDDSWQIALSGREGYWEYLDQEHCSAAAQQTCCNTNYTTLIYTDMNNFALCTLDCAEMWSNERWIAVSSICTLQCMSLFVPGWDVILRGG